MGVDKMIDRSIKIAFLVTALAAGLLLVEEASGIRGKPTHLDREKVTEGCAGCHAGRGAPGTPLLNTTPDRICFKCHGSSSSLNIKGRATTDIEEVFAKSSTHPIYSTSQYHSMGEKVPEESPSAPRHVACFDCHSSHLSENGKPIKGAPGYAPGAFRGNFGGPPPGRSKKYLEEAYELCYRCHSDSANLPSEYTNKAVEFDPNNESYHPVELPGKNSSVPSLIRELSVTSTITCTDCHGNDDRHGPLGPHGSNYAPILVAQYRTDEGTESESAYALCYLCHDRRNILGDNSFKRHRVHIASVGTSCHTCHETHGTDENQHLIRFNEDIVSPSDVSQGPSYIIQTSGRPMCYLKCHDVDHNNSAIGEQSWPW